MEEAKQTYRSSKKFTDEVIPINQLIIEFRNDAKVGNDKPKKERLKSLESLASKATVAFTIVIGSFIAAFYFLPPTTWGDNNEKMRFAVQLIVILSYVLGGFVILLYYFSAKATFKDFPDQIMNANYGSVKEEAILFESLDAFSTPDGYAR